MECWKLYDTLTRLNLIDFYKQSCFAAGAKFFAAGGKLVCRGSGGRTCFAAGGELVLPRRANLFVSGRWGANSQRC